MLLMLDNYDSFTYTLVQYFKALGEDVVVVRNDQIDIKGIKALNPSRIVISPGPCSPDEAGISIELVVEFYKHLPILGVCLGHQAIAQAFGAKIIRAPQVMHGKTSIIEHNNKGIFTGLSKTFNVTRYHSLIVENGTLPDSFTETAWTNDQSNKILMAFQMDDFPVFGLQFHPESVLTDNGMKILQKFLEY